MEQRSDSPSEDKRYPIGPVWKHVTKNYLNSVHQAIPDRTAYGLISQSSNRSWSGNRLPLISGFRQISQLFRYVSGQKVAGAWAPATCTWSIRPCKRRSRSFTDW
jgi:hypothetical protein